MQDGMPNGHFNHMVGNAGVDAVAGRKGGRVEEGAFAVRAALLPRARPCGLARPAPWCGGRRGRGGAVSADAVCGRFSPSDRRAGAFAAGRLLAGQPVAGRPVAGRSPVGRLAAKARHAEDN